MARPGTRYHARFKNAPPVGHSRPAPPRSMLARMNERNQELISYKEKHRKERKDLTAQIESERRSRIQAGALCEIEMKVVRDENKRLLKTTIIHGLMRKITDHAPKDRVFYAVDKGQILIRVWWDAGGRVWRPENSTSEAFPVYWLDESFGG